MIAKKTKYALKALTLLAENYPGQKPFLISDLATRGHIPKKFLEFILLELKKRGILHSKKGKGGGYYLAKHPDLIKLGTVMRILGGTLAPVPCLSQTAYKRCEECEDEATCHIRMIMREVHESQIKILDNTSLQDMLDKSHGLKESVMYAI